MVQGKLLKKGKRSFLAFNFKNDPILIPMPPFKRSLLYSLVLD